MLHAGHYLAKKISTMKLQDPTHNNNIFGGEKPMIML
jgi:hypothetical protein